MDIISDEHPDGWLVIGWFTPDYRALATAFAAQLKEHGAPYHLFAVSKAADAGWSTKQKPAVVSRAQRQYFGTTLILMDVDCIVRGDIRPLSLSRECDADVGITVIARNIKNNRQTINVSCSSRVVVFHPTHKAELFAARWLDEVERSEYVDDEHAMAWAYLRSPDVRFEFIDRLYSGREIDQMGLDAVVVHDSANEKNRPIGGLRGVMKAVERRVLRTGRTKRKKLDGTLAMHLQ